MDFLAGQLYLITPYSGWSCLPSWRRHNLWKYLLSSALVLPWTRDWYYADVLLLRPCPTSMLTLFIYNQVMKMTERSEWHSSCICVCSAYLLMGICRLQFLFMHSMVVSKSSSSSFAKMFFLQERKIRDRILSKVYKLRPLQFLTCVSPSALRTPGTRCRFCIFCSILGAPAWGGVFRIALPTGRERRSNWRALARPPRLRL